MGPASEYSKHPCRKCGKTTKVRWKPLPDKPTIMTDEYLAELKRLKAKRTDKPIYCHFCGVVVHIAPKETRDYEDVTLTICKNISAIDRIISNINKQVKSSNIDNAGK